MPKDNKMIVSATIKYADDPYNIPSGWYGTACLRMKLSDGSYEDMFYYHDEISIVPHEVEGKTYREAWDIYSKKDTAYLQSKGLS